MIPKPASEWFPIVLGTMVLSLVSWIDSIVFSYSILFYIGKIIYFIGIALFILIFLLWGYRYLSDPKLIKEDFGKLTRVSFTSFLGVLIFVIGFFSTVYISASSVAIHILLYAYFIGYAIVLLVNIILGYKLFSQQIKPEELNYSILVPSIALSANVILSASILPPSFPYIGKEYTEIAYFMMLIAVGITFFQFIFIGTTAFLSHINFKSAQSAPAIMIPVGASSIIAINILIFPSYNYLNVFYFPQKFAITIAIMLWGFEIWNLVVAFMLALKHIKEKMSLTVWAYVFPVGISDFSYFMLYEETKLPVFLWSISIMSIAIPLLYIYAAYNTINIVKEKLNTR
jgi:tellurite resistance protein TehA-like permease